MSMFDVDDGDDKDEDTEKLKQDDEQEEEDGWWIEHKNTGYCTRMSIQTVNIVR